MPAKHTQNAVLPVIRQFQLFSETVRMSKLGLSSPTRGCGIFLRTILRWVSCIPSVQSTKWAREAPREALAEIVKYSDERFFVPLPKTVNCTSSNFPEERNYLRCLLFRENNSSQWTKFRQELEWVMNSLRSIIIGKTIPAYGDIWWKKCNYDIM